MCQSFPSPITTNTTTLPSPSLEYYDSMHKESIYHCTSSHSTVTLSSTPYSSSSSSSSSSSCSPFPPRHPLPPPPSPPPPLHHTSSSSPFLHPQSVTTFSCLLLFLWQASSAFRRHSSWGDRSFWRPCWLLAWASGRCRGCCLLRPFHQWLHRHPHHLLSPLSRR